MTTEPNRQPEGIPAGGQFAAQLKSDDVVSLGTPSRRPELEGWPESLPAPEVSFHMGDDNVIATSVNINGEPAFDVWNPGDDVHSIETTHFDHPELADNEGFDAAETWARDKHELMSGELRAEMHAAVERSRARVLAAATGTAPHLTDDELGSLLGLNSTAAFTGQRDGELAATAVIARGVLKEHPDASHIGLRVDSADNDEFVSGAIVYNADHEVLGSYNTDEQFLTDEDDYKGAGFVEYLGHLPAAPEKSWWSTYNIPSTQPDFAFTIDLRKASAWTPGADS